MTPDDVSCGSKYDSGSDPIIKGPSGRLYSVLDPVLPGHEDLLDEIADGLANVLRFNGRTRSQYTVAQHSVLVSRLLFSTSPFAIVHDAAEAFLGDMPSPIKRVCADFARLEARWQTAILAVLKIELPEYYKGGSAVAEADRLALYCEVRAFDGYNLGLRNMGLDEAHWESVLGNPSGPLRGAVREVLSEPWSRARASEEWIQEYARVTTRRN